MLIKFFIRRSGKLCYDSSCTEDRIERAAQRRALESANENMSPMPVTDVPVGTIIRPNDQTFAIFSDDEISRMNTQNGFILPYNPQDVISLLQAPEMSRSAHC